MLPEGHKIDISGLGNNRNMIMNADLCTPSIGLATKMWAKMLKYFQKHYIKNLFITSMNNWSLEMPFTKFLCCNVADFQLCSLCKGTNLQIM